jgi:nicotinamide-nucleotide amidase
MDQTALIALAREAAESLRRRDRQLVLAESCTAGLVAASLGAIAGISRHLCGSAVVYQEATKTAWLGVSATTLATYGAVSAEAAAAMASGALARTPSADFAAAVTGHLGPDAPPGFDGTIFVSTQHRGGAAEVRTHGLGGNDSAAGDLRRSRQAEAAMFVLQAIVSALAPAKS